MGVLLVLWTFVSRILAGRADWVAEDLSLRQKPAVLQRSVKRPKPPERIGRMSGENPLRGAQRILPELRLARHAPVRVC